ncbi:hypothetical protein HYT24_01290 [Candidatus Pacearchaeota archaeon]|nr:hypothetical protein [Candidatus Pacearchaeota archaeon]
MNTLMRRFYEWRLSVVERQFSALAIEEDEMYESMPESVRVKIGSPTPDFLDFAGKNFMEDYFMDTWREMGMLIEKKSLLLAKLGEQQNAN